MKVKFVCFIKEPWRTSCCLPKAFKWGTANVVVLDLVKSARALHVVGLFSLMQTLIYLKIMTGKALKPKQGYQKAEAWIPDEKQLHFSYEGWV